MIVALSFCAKDSHLAEQLLRWIGKLSDCSTWNCILVCDAGTPFDKVIEIKGRAETVFKSATLVATERAVSGWPLGPNSNWRTAIKWGAENKRDIAFIETDAIPLKTSWLHDLNAAWEAAPEGTKYLGCIEPTRNVQLPPMVISGVGIYSHRVGEYPLAELGRPWNVDWSDLLIPFGVNSPLIKDFFGQKDLPPFFLDDDIPNRPANAFPLSWIPDQAVLFHRDKKHSLIPLLAKKYGIAWEPPRRKCEKIAVVFPVHNGDIGLALHHALWMRKLNQRWPHRAVIAFDPTLPDGAVNQFRAHLEHCFESVEWCRYATPPLPHYPFTANFMFQSVAHYMAGQNSPWLLMEADAVVLKASWLDQLQAEYERAGRTWMGPLVHALGHIQGTAVYPADAAHRMPHAMACGAGEAFDMVAKHDMLDDRHDCGHIFHHVWSILNDAPCPVGGGTVPGDLTLDQARRWFPKEAVVTHRWKTRALIDLLLTGQYQHE